MSNTKAVDIVKAVCPTAHLHYGIRRFFRNLPTRGFINLERAVLLVEDKEDPCKSQVIKEVLTDPTETFVLEWSNRTWVKTIKGIDN